jgi:hypothetical protein
LEKFLNGESNDEKSDLSNVAVRILLSFHSLQVLFLDEDVDALLDDLNLRLEARRELVENFCHQSGVVECFTHFHDANDGGLNEHFTIFFDVLVCHFLFGLLLGFKREVDVDTKFFAVKIL